LVVMTRTGRSTGIRSQRRVGCSVADIIDIIIVEGTLLQITKVTSRGFSLSWLCCGQ
jgi:hypothetical protein